MSLQVLLAGMLGAVLGWYAGEGVRWVYRKARERIGSQEGLSGPGDGFGESTKGHERMTRTRCQIYSRVVGFLTPISQWNKGKQEEFRDRKTFVKNKMKDRP